MKKIFFPLIVLMVIFSSSCGEPDNYGKDVEDITTTENVSGKEPVKIMTRSKDPFGQYLTDGRGRAMYIFMADSVGKRTCFDECAKVWPPVLTTGTPVLGDNIEKTLVSTIDVENSTSWQLAYNGWPLYYYVKDTGPGDVNGQDIETHGAEWYLINPQGQKIEEDHH